MSASVAAVWEVVTPEPGQRALSTGLEVLAGAPVLLIHSATQKPLLVSLLLVVSYTTCGWYNWQAAVAAMQCK
jgi:hypothetical protein